MDKENLLVSALRREETLFRNTGNPLHVWRAIDMCLSEIEPKPLPGWCLIYLKDVSANLKALSWRKDFRVKDKEKKISSKAATELLAPALGLTRKGWNAFTAAHNWFEKEVERLVYADLRLVSKSEVAIEMLRKRRGLSDTSAMRRRIAQALKALPPTEGGT